MNYKEITPEDVLRLKAPTKGYLCPLNANRYGIEFQSFKIKDYETKRTIFDVSRENAAAVAAASAVANLGEDSYRHIRYNFSEDVLRTPTISTNLTFSVGDYEVEDFRMIERHYVGDKLVKSYDFTFGFVIPCSTNTWEAVYAVPLLDEDIIDEMVNNPFKTTSDSFYFVNNELVMHNKASYNYSAEPAEAKPTAAGAAGAKAGAKSSSGAGMKYAAKMTAPSKNAPRAIPAEAKAGAKAAF
mmetsp:Transcript_17291/g.43863  ORF Transcript_17291/g.43863 Transcript_17291/m.43863 type:complete len:242 (+) Transcript_17291:205-930(+)|eukprot:CAMPEP_0202038652 /NCGR_PEP_ID=MMETSP0962-20130828/11316_1 /ASSEMBLY_ACC=CAM_ASM_000488 /TAXON_ID=4773 /ORGANISM="Schizochytrium aggregatum, Strain ATCC28209" /LENGTH=241 /DNA_ID=CAMNT_0048602825 /DNA_START=179 /DNA_END=904 /DNA_ORIENTATION=+